MEEFKRIDENVIDMSPDMMNIYGMLSNYTKTHKSYNNDTGKLIITMINDYSLNDSRFKVIWGYKSDPDNSVSLNELKSIKFIGNLDIMIEENCITNCIDPTTAMISIISAHFKRNTFQKKIAMGPSNPCLYKFNIYLAKDEDKTRWI